MGRFENWLRRVMTGRYGTDRLNMVILGAGLTLAVASMFFPAHWAQPRLLVTLVAYGLMGWAIFRSFSRSTQRRYEENRRFMQFWQRLTDRRHKYYKCPNCKQRVRVPKGKGKISITCPRCRNKIIKET